MFSLRRVARDPSRGSYDPYRHRHIRSDLGPLAPPRGPKARTTGGDRSCRRRRRGPPLAVGRTDAGSIKGCAVALRERRPQEEVCALIVRHNKYFYPLYMGITCLGALPAVLAYPNGRLHPEKFRQGLEGMSKRSGLDHILTERGLSARERARGVALSTRSAPSINAHGRRGDQRLCRGNRAEQPAGVPPEVRLAAPAGCCHPLHERTWRRHDRGETARFQSFSSRCRNLSAVAANAQAEATINNDGSREGSQRRAGLAPGARDS